MAESAGSTGADVKGDGPAQPTNSPARTANNTVMVIGDVLVTPHLHEREYDPDTGAASTESVVNQNGSSLLAIEIVQMRLNPVTESIGSWNHSPASRSRGVGMDDARLR